MANLDLSGQASIKINWISDPLSGLSTLTFLTSLNVVLGELILETNRWHAMLDALAVVDLVRNPSGVQKHRTHYENDTQQSVTVFFA